MPIQRNPATGKIITKRFSYRALEKAAENFEGFCRACGAKQRGVDPDGCRYACKKCGLHYVYGAEELVLMGCTKV